MSVAIPAPTLRISPVRLHNVGILALAILAPILIGLATLGRGLADPELRGPMVAVTVLALVACAWLEIKVRRAYVALAAGRLSWRKPVEWRSHDRPVLTVSRVQVSDKGDMQIRFPNGEKPLELSAKEFRREDLRGLVRALSATAGRDLLNS